MTIDQRLAVLDHLYAVYDRFCQSLGVLACRKFCADCCSRHVTMTTLEGLHLLQGLETNQRRDCLATLARDVDEAIFQPRWTTNQIATRIREGHEAPDDDVAHDGSHCSLLADAACPLYAVRPFGCRCMLSRHVCPDQGYADVDDYVLTVNTVFLQTIEHVDRPGCFGNLQDVLLALGNEDKMAAYRDGRPPEEAPGLIPNHPAPMLMVPPEHRERIEPLLAEMQGGMGG